MNAKQLGLTNKGGLCGVTRRRAPWAAQVAGLWLVTASCASEMASDGADLSMVTPPTAGTTGGSQTTSATAMDSSAMSTTPAVAGSSGTMTAMSTTTTTATNPGAQAGQGDMAMAGMGAAGAPGLTGTGEAGTSAMEAGAAGSSAAEGAAGSMEMGMEMAAAGSSAATDAGNGAVDMGAAGAAGAPDMATDTMEHEDLGEGDGSDVVLIGDSWMDNTLQFEGTGGGVAPSLIAVSMQPYRNYGLQGVMLLTADSFGPAIPSQWDDAKRENPDVKTVVMTAGGNDIIQGSSTLQSSCSMGTDECKQKLVEISNALDKLWTQMAEDGVQDIVHIRYTDNTGTLHPDLQGSKGLPTPSICLSGKVRCHAVETTDIVAATDLAVDGIHPLQSANSRIAKRTYELMTSEGMRR